MPCIPAPACKQALAEATQRWPNRSRASDGICASATHSSQNSTSDHEVGNAFDLTHDPANGCDAHYMVRELAERRDSRVKYIISQGQIWNPTISYAWRSYSGSNPHNKHAHVSIRPHVRNDTSPWWTKPKPPPSIQVWDYKEEDVKTAFLSVPLDKDGNGWKDWNPGLGRDPIIVGVARQGPYPPKDGYWYAAKPIPSAQARGGAVIVSVEGGRPGSSVGVFVAVA